MSTQTSTARVRASAGVADWVRWLTAVVVGGPVALSAAVISYEQMRHLVEAHGFGWLAFLAPLTVDGLMMAATLTLFVRHRDGDRGGARAWAALGLGVLASVAANVAAVGGRDGIAHLIAAWPPVALFLAYELLVQQIRAARRRTAASAASTDRPPRPARTAPTPEPFADRPADASPVRTAPGRSGPFAGPHPARRSGPADAEGGNGPGPDVSDLLGPARAVADRVGPDRRLTRSALIAGLREDGHSVGTDRASVLLRALTDAPAPPPGAATSTNTSTATSTATSDEDAA